MIDAERYKKIDQIFQAALELSLDERSSYISEACEGDESLLREVEFLLASDQQGWELIDNPAFEMAAPLLARDKPELSAGERLGHYNIISLLGAGGMGQVYLAEDTRLGRKVALKLLPEGFMRSESRLRRFQQEARAASALNHPNTLTIYDIWEIEGRHVIATEYVEGESLRQRIEQKNLSTEETLDISIQMSSAISAAHQAGIIHRDIKPENIMLRSDGLIKALDFGLAKLVEGQGLVAEKVTTDLAQEIVEEKLPADKSLVEGNNRLTTGAGLLLGTLPYMSPEQLKGEQLDTRTDIFSLGVVIYEMISGRKPFDAENDGDMITSIISDDPPLIQQHAPDIPFELCRIIDKSLRKGREERYQTALDLLADLKSLKEKSIAGGSQFAVASTERSSSSISHLPDARDASIATYIIHRIKAHKAITVIVLLIAAVFGLTYALRRTPGKSHAAFERIKITNVPGIDNSALAALSGDGRYLVYEIIKPGRRSLWLREIPTNIDREIVPPAAVTFLGANVSRDGDYIYYAVKDEQNHDGAIYRVPLMGGDAERLLRNIVGYITFSPDSKRLAFIRRMSKEETALMVANADGSGERSVAVRRQPEFFIGSGLSWSPDRDVIACTGRLSGASAYMNIVEVEVETGSERAIGSRTWAAAYEIGWLPDGRGLLMAGTDEGQENRHIWHISYPEGEAREVTHDLNNYGGISMTADGSSFATMQYEMRTSIWLVDVSSGEAGPVTTPNRHIYRFLSWTPDGRIVFPSNASGDRDIWIMNLDGRAEKQLTANAGENLHSSVSPDGRYIVFSSSRVDASNFSIWRMNIDGSNPLQLTKGSNDIQPRCSPDGRWIVYTSEQAGERTLWKVSFEGGESMQLTDNPSEWPDLSPDGKLIACWYREKDSGKWKIAILPFEGGTPIKMFDGLSGPARAIRWTPDGSAITYVVTRNEISNLWSQPLNEASPRQLTDFKSELIYNFDWSRDAKLICSRGYTARNVMLISESQ